MLGILITFIVVFLFVRWGWKIWGKDFSKKLDEELTEELNGDDYERRESLIMRIEDLKREINDLKDTKEDYERRESLYIRIEALKEEKVDIEQKLK
jgi:hypothetical protein